MNLWVCLLRGINVGADRKLPMADLKAYMAALGAEKIETYIQSGNVVFEGDITPDEFAKALCKAVAADRGYTPEVLVLTAEALLAAQAAYPFAPDATGDKPAHIFFCATTPTTPDLPKLESLATETEVFALNGSLFFLRAPEGIGRSKLAAGAERALGVPTTARNLKTVAKLAEMIRARG